MSFRPSILKICRSVAFAGIVGLMLVAISRAGEPIEVVPSRGSTLETNVQQPTETKDFENMGPHAPHSFHLAAPTPTLTLPLPQQRAVPLTEREKELLDLRKNWVFMTPEDMVGQAESDLSGGTMDKDKDGLDKKATTAMERYYQHLYDSDRAGTTNHISKPDSDSWSGATNTVVGDAAHSSGGLLGTPSDLGVFQPSHENTFSDVFGSGGNNGQPSPETIRSQEAQKEHMESFKQLWDIDQPVTPPSAAAAAASAPSSPSPVFGTPSAGQPAINTFNASLGGLSGQAPAAAPALPTITSSRAIAPPRATFAPPQREF